MTTPEIPTNREFSEPKKPDSPAHTLGKLWDTFIRKESTEAEKKRMSTVLDGQKTELLKVVESYRSDKEDVIGKGKQSKLSLLNDVKQTVNDLRNLSGADISNSQRGVIEDRYEKIEEKITGTKEIVDFKNPEFITQAIGNLEAFEKALNPVDQADEKLLRTIATEKAVADVRIAADKARAAEEVKKSAAVAPAVAAPPPAATPAFEKNADFSKKILRDEDPGLKARGF